MLWQRLGGGGVDTELLASGICGCHTGSWSVGVVNRCICGLMGYAVGC